TTSPSVEELLQASSATPEFKKAVTELSSGGRSSERVGFAAGNPPVKVLRAVCGLLEHQPSLAIDRVEVEGASGCSDYRGNISVNGGEKKFTFVWDCAWKAEQVGFKDFFGGYDQIKAARTFGYQCFQVFKEV
ncbi:MAG: hypothetical protein ABI579_04965, partial [Candidatus Sumerlaeota bacterium]